jgi:aspartate/methionine/tyrosine aminotransferase
MRGEPDFPTPAHISQACAAALSSGRTGYPDNRGEKGFREAVAAKLQRDNDLAFDPATEILATTGATFGIWAALTVLLQEGGDVLLPDPVYDAYRSPILLCGGNPITAESRIADGRFTLNEEALERSRTPDTKVLILNTPWNPVGTVFTREELAAIGLFCLRHKITLLSDEIYEAITFGHPHVSPLAAAPELRSQHVLINSLSKTYAMPGWRVGYCAGPSDLIQSMFMVLAQSSRGPATFIQDAAAEALAGPQDSVTTMRDAYAQRRQQVIDALSKIPGVSVMEPEGGFFAMLDVRGLAPSSDSIRRSLLNEHGVVVVHGAAYGPGGEGTLRVSFASGGDNLRAGLEKLRAGLIAQPRR